MLGFISNMKSILMVGVACVLFFTNASAHDGGSYNITLLIEIHFERSLMISCLVFGIFPIKLMVEFPYSILCICCI